VRWWWKSETQNGLWQEIVKDCYLRNKTIATVLPRFSDSPCWKSLLQVKDVYFAGRKVKLKMGDIVRFWKDPWDPGPILAEHYPELFNI
jgi:hypothetical protein